MSIVTGGGYASCSVALGLTGNYTFYVLAKTSDSAQYDCFAAYANSGTANYISCEVEGTIASGRSVQQFAAKGEDSTLPPEDTWFAMIVKGSSSDNVPSVVTANGVNDSVGNSGTFASESSPFVILFQRPDGSRPCISGVKIGAIAVYDAELSDVDAAALVAGGDPSDANLVALWVDSEGVVKDGSNNLTSWTDVIGSEVLTPTGTVTVDDTDLAPHGYIPATSPALTSPTDPVELGSTGNTVTKTNFSGDITLKDQGSGYAYTITAQTSSTVTFNGPPLTTITEASGGVVVPEPGAAVTLVGTHTPTDPDEVATVATNISLPTGYAQVTLSGSGNVAGTVGYGIDAIHGVTVADGWIFVYPTADSTSVSADGTLYTNSDDLYIYGWNPTDDKMYGVRGLWVTPAGIARKTFNIGIGISI